MTQRSTPKYNTKEKRNTVEASMVESDHKNLNLNNLKTIPEIEARAIKIFLITFLLSKIQTVFTRRYPRYAIWTYVGKDKRRLHHLETGEYIIAIGLALFLDDIHDIKAEVEYYDRHQSITKKKKRFIDRRLVTFKRRRRMD